MSAVKKQAFDLLEWKKKSNSRHFDHSSLSVSVTGAEWIAALPGGVVLIQADGRVSDCNTQALDMLGAPLLFERWEEVIHRAFYPRADDGHDVSLRDGRKVRIAFQPLPAGEGQLVQLLDVTESRIWQEQVAHQQRVHALGRMAASLAHQLRTPLSTATLYAAHLRNPEVSEVHRLRFADQLAQQLQVMEAQIRSLLLLAKRELPLTDRINVREWSASWQQRLQHQPNKQVRLVLDHHDDVPEIIGHRLALDEAIQNLLRNAEEASSPGVPILLEFGWQHGRLWVSVKDHGTGMDESTRLSIESPFFTTKANGTGLGLALVRMIVEAHLGTLVIESELGKGSMFGMYFSKVSEVSS